MMTLNNIPREAYTVSKAPGLPVARMLTSAIPFVALAVPGAAFAQSAENTATITAPSGAIETDTSNNSATDTDTVLANLLAVDDSATVSSSAAAQAGVLNVLTGDEINGVAATATTVDISLAPSETLPSQLTFDTSTGAVGVVAGTPAGVYSFDYQICEAGTTNCETATATVTVQPTLVAVSDSVTVSSSTAAQAGVLNVLADDTIDGAAATTANVDISLPTGVTVPSQLTFDTTTGAVGVVAGTPAGVYSFDYQICEEGGSSFCETATATVTVQPTIIAVDDSVTVSSSATAQAAVLNVLTDDTIDGAAATTANVDISLPTGVTVPSQLTFDTATGAVGVAAGTPAGTYSFDYQICEEGGTSFCQTATATVIVQPTIVAVDDSTTVGSSASAQAGVLNVLSDDTIDGAAATTANVDISLAPGATVPSALTFDPATGAIGVVAGAAAGTYSFDYQICEDGGTSFCQTATATVTVVDITADADSASGINGVTGNASVLNVLDGDTLNGAAISDPADVVISLAPGESLPSELTFDTATGIVGVAANTPAGAYTFDYQICDAANTSICATNTVTVIVAPSVDLSITKTNGVTSVTSGQTVTYEITVTNSGPDTATGALLRDTPGAGLTCPVTNPLSFSGSGIPTGSFTVGDLVGAGITLGSLANGQSITVTYDCTVD